MAIANIGVVVEVPWENDCCHLSLRCLAYEYQRILAMENRPISEMCWRGGFWRSADLTEREESGGGDFSGGGRCS